MRNSLTSQLNEALDILVEKTDELQKAMPLDKEQEAHLVAGFERLTEVVANMERQQKAESRLAKKIEDIVPRLNKVLKKQDRVANGVKGDLAENIERIARIVKVVGQAAEIVAGSMQVISKALRENKPATPNSEKKDEKTDTIDLSEILTQLNNLIGNQDKEQSTSDEA